MVVVIVAVAAAAAAAAAELELELTQSHMAQKPVLQDEVGCACDSTNTNTP